MHHRVVASLWLFAAVGCAPPTPLKDIAFIEGPRRGAFNNEQAKWDVARDKDGGISGLIRILVGGSLKDFIGFRQPRDGTSIEFTSYPASGFVSHVSTDTLRRAPSQADDDPQSDGELAFAEASRFA